MSLDLVLPSGKVTLGDMARQSPDNVDIHGGRIVKLKDLQAFRGSIDEFTAKRLTVAAGGAATLKSGLTFDGVGLRIMGDFSNIADTKRAVFQDATLNQPTTVGVMPNGTNTFSGLNLYGSSDLPNSAVFQAFISGTSVAGLAAYQNGAGAVPRMDFFRGSTVDLRIDTNDNVVVAPTIATPAAGSTAARLIFGTTAGFGIYYGSGAPTVVAAKGSLYLRSDGSGTTNRAYIATDAAGTWTALTTVA